MNAVQSVGVSSGDEITAAPLVRPWWRRARLWFVLLAVAVLAGTVVATLSDEPGRPLDPTSAHKNGSKAVARLLAHYGAHVRATRNLAAALDPAAAVVVTAPNDYSSGQLRRLAAGAGRLVLIRPGTRAGNAIVPGLEPGITEPSDTADCSDAGATAAGAVDLPGDTLVYTPGSGGTSRCFGGAVLVGPRLAVLGSSQLLRNDHLDDDGVAALDINVITDSRQLTSVVWLLPGADTAGPGPASIWDLFPSGAYRAFWWLVAVGVLAALWRARRLGGVVFEPLPVVVRSAEVVEGHGRLYARAGARDRAASALRSAAVSRVGHRLGLPRGAPAEQVGVAAAPIIARPPAEVVSLLAGPPPADDRALLQLAAALDHFEAAVGGATKERTPS